MTRIDKPGLDAMTRCAAHAEVHQGMLRFIQACNSIAVAEADLLTLVNSVRWVLVWLTARGCVSDGGGAITGRIFLIQGAVVLSLANDPDQDELQCAS